MRTPLGMSLGFQLHAELHLPLEKQDFFFNRRLLLCVSGREVTHRDLSRVLPKTKQLSSTQRGCVLPGHPSLASRWTHHP